MDQNTVIDGDIFGGLLPLCHVSASQEDHLRRCPFAPEPYNAGPESSDSDSDSDSDAIPVESTAIMMVSPPDSLEFRDNNSAASNDVFQTPPEYSTMLSSQDHPPPPPPSAVPTEGYDADVAVDGGSQTVVVDVDDSGTVTVELGLDSELGFSEVQEETQSVKNSQSEPLGFRVLSEEQQEEEEEEDPYEPPFKKSKIPTRNPAESSGGLESDTVNRRNYRSRSHQHVEFNGGGRCGDAEFGEETEANGVVSEERNAEGGAEDGLITKKGHENEPDREILESAAMADEHGKGQQRRLLPNWIGGAEKEENRNENEVKEVKSKSSYSILYALNLLKKLGGGGDDDDNDDDSVPRYGFVEICKQKGIIFPHPSWWPEGDF